MLDKTGEDWAALGRAAGERVRAPIVSRACWASMWRVKWEYPGIEGVWYDLDKPVNILTEFANAQGVEYPPLLPLYRRCLKEHQGPVERIHYSSDGHWTPLGHSLAVEAILKKIVADRLYERES